MTKLPVMCAVNSPPRPRKLITSALPAIRLSRLGSSFVASEPSTEGADNHVPCVQTCLSLITLDRASRAEGFSAGCRQSVRVAWRAVRNQGNYAFSAGRSHLIRSGQSSITIMPILVIRKGILRSFVHAANLVKLLLAFLESSSKETRSCFSALIACPDGTRLIIASPYFRVDLVSYGRSAVPMGSARGKAGRD